VRIFKLLEEGGVILSLAHSSNVIFSSFVWISSQLTLEDMREDAGGEEGEGEGGNYLCASYISNTF